MPALTPTAVRAWRLALSLMLLVVATGCGQAGDDPLGDFDIGKSLIGLGHGRSVEPAEAQAWCGELTELINELRAEHGLWPLTADPTLAEVAKAYAEQMIEDGFFGHLHPATGSSVGTRARAAGYEFWKVGENLAAGHLSPQQVFEAWKSSPQHRANLLDPDWQDIGLGIRAGGSYGLYFVAEFGWPQG